MSIQGKLHRPWLAHNYFFTGFYQSRQEEKGKNSKIDGIEVTKILKLLYLEL